MGIASNNIIIGTIPNLNLYFVNATNLAQPGNFDLHLKPGCTAIDSGTATNAPLTDFDGVSRPQGARFDIGAYEFIPTTTLSGTITNQTNVLCNGGNNGNVTVAGSNGTPGYTYSLNGGTYQSSGTFSGLTAGVKTITVKDGSAGS